MLTTFRCLGYVYLSFLSLSCNCVLVLFLYFFFGSTVVVYMAVSVVESNKAREMVRLTTKCRNVWSKAGRKGNRRVGAFFSGDC